MKVLLLSRYTEVGASSRHRSYQYLPFLRERGYEITVLPLLSDMYLKRLYSHQPLSLLDLVRSYIRRVIHLLRLTRYDLIWLEYEAFPWIPYLFESIFLNTRTPYIVDYDDAVFHRYDQHSSGIVNQLLGTKIDRVMRGAALVIVGNEYIASRASDAGAINIKLLPTTINLDKYRLQPPPQNQSFTIGWVGSPITSRYLKIVEEALITIQQKSSMRLIVIGATNIRMSGIAYEPRPWSETTEIDEIANFDVGIMPLPDLPWERGKCGLKLIQYMACSRPVVASPVGVNRKIVEHNVNGFLASSTQDWISSLATLRDNPHLREKLGKTGREKIEKQYCTRVTAPLLASFLDEAAGRFF